MNVSIYINKTTLFRLMEFSIKLHTISNDGPLYILGVAGYNLQNYCFSFYKNIFCLDGFWFSKGLS